MRQKIEALIQTDGGWLRFSDPARVLQARDAPAVTRVLTEVDRVTRQTGHVAVGFVTYEAAAAFALPVCRRESEDELPLAWFGLFDSEHVERLPCLATDTRPYDLQALAASLDRSSFEAAVHRIREHLAAGDTYQANYTFRLDGVFRGDARSFFADLVAAQQGRHSAFIDLGTHAICSASPELFFARTGSTVTARPMKGTAARGRTLAEDRRRRDDLRASLKEQAENVMIVDMMRNDLGRVAATGSVQVSELFAVERYPNVWQMTSVVTARSAASLPDLFAALHPSASVTGAPKLRTMAILRELENRPRGLYTGAIGYVEPGGDAHFNVAIRTAVVNRQAETVSFGVGSGIVWDSDPAAEYRECLLKASVLGTRPREFDLLETLRWSRDAGFVLLDRHLARMRESAEYFGFAFDETVVRAALESLDASLKPTGTPDIRVRLLVSRLGIARVEHRPLRRSTAVMTVQMARDPVDADDPFLFHKTTNRTVYDRARSAMNPSNPSNLSNPDEVILWNPSGEVTEATTANIVVEIDGQLVTPPVACGLLAGTFRAELLATGEARETVVTVDQLRRARRMWLINSVQGWREARLSDQEHTGGMENPQ